ncbi:MAG: 1-deoxy-D-xylulose-5-phosphate reductoisomerase, partial [Oscillospiraceae bacterium]
MKKISLIGCTGSIGRQAIEVALANSDKFKIVAMAADSSYKLFEEQINAVKPKFCALADEEAGKKVFEVPSGTTFACGKEAALAAASYEEADVVLVAASGFAGLRYSLAAIRAGKT